MKIGECRIGMKVCTKEGYIGTVVGMQSKELVIVSFGPRSLPYQAGELSHVSDPCEGCQKLAEVRADRDNWKATAQQYCCNAAYWRGALEKLQKEALAEYRLLSEVATIYVQVSPEELGRILEEREE